MARIPTVAAPGQAVGTVRTGFTPQPFQRLSTNANMFGAAEGKRMQNASAALDAFASDLKEMQLQDDESLLTEIKAQLKRKSVDILQNPNSGILSRMQKNAIGSSSDALAAFDKEVSSLKRLPQSVEGKDSYNKLVLSLRGGLTEKSYAHERTQNLEYKKTLFTTEIGTSQQDMGLYFNSDKDLEDNESSIRTASAKHAKLQGIDPTELAEKNISSGYLQAIQSAVVAQDYTRAASILKTHESKLGAEDLKTARVAVQDATVLGEAQSAAKNILQDASLTTDQARMDATRNIKDPKIQEKARAIVKEEISVRNTLKDREISDRFDRVANSALGNQPVNPADRAGFSARQNAYIDARITEGKLRAADPDYQRPGDGGTTYGTYIDDTRDPSYLPTLSLSQLKEKYETGVTKAEFDVILSEWRTASINANNLAATDAKKLLEEKRTLPLPSDILQLKAVALAAGIDANDKDDRERYAAWVTEFSRRVAEEGASTPLERKAIIDSMGRDKVVYDTDFRDESAPSFEMTDDNKDELAGELDINKAARPVFSSSFSALSSSIRAQRGAPSRDTIKKEWQRFLDVSTTLSLPTADVPFLISNWSTMTSVLLKNGARLTPQNYVTLWNNNVRSRNP